MDILLFHFRGVGGLEDQFWLSKVGVQDYFNDRPLQDTRKIIDYPGDYPGLSMIINNILRIAMLMA